MPADKLHLLLPGINVAPHPLMHMPLDMLRRQMEVNFIAQLQVIQAGPLSMQPEITCLHLSQAPIVGHQSE